MIDKLSPGKLKLLLIAGVVAPIAMYFYSQYSYEQKAAHATIKAVKMDSIAMKMPEALKKPEVSVPVPVPTPQPTPAPVVYSPPPPHEIASSTPLPSAPVPPTARVAEQPPQMALTLLSPAPSLDENKTHRVTYRELLRELNGSELGREESVQTRRPERLANVAYVRVGERLVRFKLDSAWPIETRTRLQMKPPSNDLVLDSSLALVADGPCIVDKIKSVELKPVNSTSTSCVIGRYFESAGYVARFPASAMTLTGASRSHSPASAKQRPIINFKRNKIYLTLEAN